MMFHYNLIESAHKIVVSKAVTIYNKVVLFRYNFKIEHNYVNDWKIQEKNYS